MSLSRGGVAHLITMGSGIHEFNHVFVADGVARPPKVGFARIVELDFDTVRGLTVNTVAGNVWVPAADCQATYRLDPSDL